MGNENDLNRETKKIQKMRNEAIKNHNRKVKTIASDEDDSDLDDDNLNIDKEKEKQIDEYDKEISKMLFDEEAELDEGERLKKNRKKMDKKSELKSYAEEIAEEQFMEEINRSKSVNKLQTRRRGSSDDDSDSDDFDAYQRWKEKKKKKKKNKEKNEKSNNIKIKVNDEEEEEEEEKIKKNKKKRNISGNKYQRNIKTERTRDNDNININEELEKNQRNDKKEKSKKSGGGFFSFGRKKNKEKEERKNINNGSNQKPSYNFSVQEPTTNSIPTYNNIGGTPMGNNQVYSPQQNYNPNQMGGSINGYNQMYGVPNNMGIYGSTTGQNPGFLYMDQTPSSYQQAHQPEKKGFTFFGKKSAISKNAYSKIKPEDLRVVLLYMKNSNNKYQEGIDLCGKRNYSEAQKCFLQAKNSYMCLGKLMNGNPKAYPTEFRMVISQKINEKLTLVHQSLRECSSFLRDQNSNQILKNPEKAKDILRNISQNQNNNNNNDFNNFNFNTNNNLNNNMNNRNENDNQNKKKNIHDKEEEEMDEKIASEIMSSNPGVKFSDIIGMEEMKKILYEIIVVPTIRPDLFTGIRKPQRGILLFGPPGTGKTMIAKAIASECNSTFFNISASSLTSKWVGESEKTVKSLFKLAYKKVPSIIFIDEIDSILSKRSENENEATKRLKTEFLIQFDGLGSNTNARLLVIAATNRPMDLDEALLRRLPKRVYCGPLDAKGRFQFIKKVINRVETNLSDKDIQDIAKITKGYSNSDLKELCKEAAFQPVRELTMDQILKIKKFRPLVKKDLLKACNKIRGTLSHKVIDELLQWNEQFGGV